MKDLDLRQFPRIDAQRLVPQFQEDSLWYKRGPVAETIYELMPDSLHQGQRDLIWPNGTRTRALKPQYTGLHSGNYDLSCRSYGVALVGSFGEIHPTDKALATARIAIAEYSPQQIIGHREVVQTACPGDAYYGPSAWGKKLSVLS